MMRVLVFVYLCPLIRVYRRIDATLFQVDHACVLFPVRVQVIALRRQGFLILHFDSA